VGQSRDITMFSAILTFVAYFALYKDNIAVKLINIYDLIFNEIKLRRFKLVYMGETIFEVLKHSFEIFLIPVAVAAIVSLMVNFAQIGGLRFKSEQFINLGSLNPISNFKQLFSLHNLIKFFKNILAVTLISVLSYLIIKRSVASLFWSVTYTLLQMIWLCLILLAQIVAATLAVYLIFAAVDLWMEKRRLFNQLKMTKDEVKREFKDTEGNPEVKGRRRELHQEILEGEGLENTIRDSSLILANPTHIAIVILFSPKKWPLPIVLIKARNYHAQLIFEIARRNKVPILRNKWLAREMYVYAEIGKYVPRRFIASVADVIKNNLHLLPKIASDLKTAATPVAPVSPPLNTTPPPPSAPAAASSVKVNNYI
ncbi:MAG: EscU/YscU/HrcU family type III secretion system export apparatus switch protein, partial [Burkholderiales bacterium]